MSQALALLDAIEDLYRRAVEDSEGIGDEALAGWLEGAVSAMDAPPDRVTAREAAKAARRARRVARYWSVPDRDGSHLPDWRNGVDEALGAAAWRPSLEIARRGLEIDPGPEVYAVVQDLFRIVHFQPWMEGVSFEEYLAGR